MIVYVDLLFIFNFVINCLFLYLLELTYHEKISRLRILCGGFVGGLLILAFLTDYVFYILCKIFGGALVTLVGVKKRSLIQTLMKMASFYLINYASVGMVGSFRINKWYLLTAAFSALVLLLFFVNNKKASIFVNSLKYNISVTFNKTIIKTNGYLDTGNFSRTDDMPIIFMAKKYRPSDCYYKSVALHTISGLTLCKVFKPTSFAVEINNAYVIYDVLIAFSDLPGFDCLLNADLFIMEGGRNVKSNL